MINDSFYVLVVRKKKSYLYCTIIGMYIKTIPWNLIDSNHTIYLYAQINICFL